LTRLRIVCLSLPLAGLCACAPSFGANSGLYGCGDDDGRPSDTIRLRFDPGGRSVIVIHRDRSYTMFLNRALFFEDEYRGDGARLTLDPEANLYLPDGERIGVCNRID
jgi:hypothetical protein